MLMNRHAIATATLFSLVLTGCSVSSPDKLSEPRMTGDTQLTILQTTDVHHAGNGVGQATSTAPAELGSYARISAYVNHVRNTVGHPVILVDSGDWSMGTLYDLTLSEQPLCLYYMDTLRYNCITLGNHEFDFTPAGLATALASAKRTFSISVPMVATNIDLNGDASLAPYIGANKQVAPTRVETLSNGLKVGYLGLMGKAAASAAPASAPVRFTDFSTNYTFIQDLVDDLRNAKGCQVVVALSHSGTDSTGTSGEDVDLAKHVTGIDVIASGHNHNTLANAKTITNGNWNTQIICAGAYGTNVARIDLTYHTSTRNTTLTASENQVMTDANLEAIRPGLTADPGIAFMVRSTDLQLNRGLKDLFAPIFPDYSASDPSKGVYKPVGASLQAMESNAKNPVPCPNGMGNLCADSVRNIPNGIIGQLLAAVDGDITQLPPGIDPTPYTAGVVATGIIRNSLPAGMPLTFADIYNTLPLGISPDQTQAIPVGYPLVSAYMELEGLKNLCALQLVAQTGLASSDYYLNFSGISYTLDAQISDSGYTSSKTYAYFKCASAAMILQVTSEKALAGSVAAGTAMAALQQLSQDGGVAMMNAIGSGNVYATAMAQLNDTSFPADPTTNLGVLGQVATLAAMDAARGTTTLSAFLVSKAIAAIDTVSGFAPTDAACTSGSAPLLASSRYRVASNFYMFLAMGAAQAQFGLPITAYQASTGSKVLSSTDMLNLLEKRINLDPTSPKTLEIKEWMALLLYLTTPPAMGGHFTSGTIGAEYASSPDFSKWGTSNFGVAVQVRSASYPIAPIGQLMTTLGVLTNASAP